MSCILEMEPSVDLARLPPDIIRRILQMEPESVDRMRMISKSWNPFAYDIKIGSPALERVYLCTGMRAKANEQISTFEAAKRVYMYSIIPGWYSTKVGVGKWLQINAKYDDGAIEVACSPTRIERPNGYLGIIGPNCILSMALNIPLMFIFAIVAPFFYPFILIVYYTIVFIGMIIACRRSYNKGRNARQGHARITRFFSSFSRIKTLVLENFNDASVLKAAQTTLSGVNIDRLEIRGSHLSELLQKRIIDFCLTHNTRQLFATTSGISGDFSTFVIELSKIGTSFEVYETSGSNNRIYMNKSLRQWNNVKNDLINQGISLRIATAHDASFKQNDYKFGVKTHIKCEKNADCDGQPLCPVLISRGFNWG